MDTDTIMQCDTCGTIGTQDDLIEIDGECAHDECDGTIQPRWEDASTNTYSAHSTVIGPYTVTVCEDDEGPLHPAYYWTVQNSELSGVDGWSSTVALAEKDAIAAAKELTGLR